MIVKSLTVSMFGTNCYLAACPQTNEAVIIDPGADGKGIIDLVKSLQYTVKYILNTHGHIDHIGANGNLKAEYSVPILLHEADLKIYNNPGFGLGLVLKKQPQPDRYISHGDLIEFGSESLTVIETPGHSPGGVCFYSGSLLFCGDTLFSGSIGRTDLAGGSFETLMSSICQKILPLPAETVVYPGHGPATSVKNEVSSNPFIVNYLQK